jgi:hypothetical protein
VFVEKRGWSSKEQSQNPRRRVQLRDLWHRSFLVGDGAWQRLENSVHVSDSRFIGTIGAWKVLFS